MKRRMNNVNFNLKNTKNTKDEHIILIFRYNGHRLKYYTNLKVHPNDWNPKKQRAKEGGFEDLIELNKQLDLIERTAKGIYLRYLNKETPLNPKTFKIELDKILDPDREPEDSFFGYFERFIEQGKISGGKNGGPKSPNTLANYKTVKGMLKRYAETLPSKRLDYEDFDMKFYEDFQTWYYSQGYATNYFGKIITVLKTVLAKAHESKLYKTNDPVYNKKAFKAPSKETDEIYLDLDELSTIYSLDLSDNKRLEKVRDLFIIECFTALRYSDMVNLTPEHFKLIEDKKTGEKRHFLTMFTEKTGEEIALPVNPTVIEILERYNWQLPEPISNQKFNKYLKEIGEKAGINSMERDSRRTGNRETGYTRINKMVPKYELITTHTGRRTFTSNTDAPAHVIMSMVGHKSPAMFLKYNKKKPLDKAKIAISSEYLSTPLLRKVK